MPRLAIISLLPLLQIAGVAADTTRVELPVSAVATGAWHISGAYVDLPLGTERPVLISTPQNARPGSAAIGAVSVSFEISEKGIPFNIQVDKSSDKELDDEVIALIREWRFEAAMRNGIPLASHGYLDFVLGDGIRRPVPRKKK